MKCEDICYTTGMNKRFFLIVGFLLFVVVLVFLKTSREPLDQTTVRISPTPTYIRVQLMQVTPTPMQ
jgi:hypothetical protein